MPTAPKRPCVDQPCPAFAVRAGRCLPHARAHDATRPHWSERYGADWPAKRARVLAEQPICAVCGNEPSVEVDHVVPVSQGGSLSEENTRGIGRRCHDAKSALERAAATRRGDKSRAYKVLQVLGPESPEPILTPHMSRGRA